MRFPREISIPKEETIRMIKRVDHITFPRVLGEMVRNEPAFKGIAYTHTYPKSKAEVPCIRYKLVRRTPGHEGVEPYKPRLRFTFKNEDGTIAEVWSQWMLCSYQFDCCALSSDEAEDLCWMFDDYITQQVGELKKLGVSEMWFDEEGEDALLKPSIDVECRTIRWMVRMDAVRLRNSDPIRALQIHEFLPQEEAVEAVVHGSDIEQPDWLQQTYISTVLLVSNPSTSGIARQEDYVRDIDFQVVFDPETHTTGLLWIEPGKRPEPGATYYVRYNHWTAFRTLYIP
jgi:hypothetical protein